MSCTAISVARRLSWLPLALAILGPLPVSAATFAVNNTQDVRDAALADGVCETAPGNGVCTLRAAIQESNSLTGADMILLPAGTYTIVLPPTSTGLDTNGSFDIFDDLTIDGAGADSTFIDGAARDSVFTSLGSSRTINISGVTIQNGAVSAFGAGIYAEGRNDLTLTDVVIRNNHAGDGGGIYNRGTLTLLRTLIFDNTAVQVAPGSVEFRQGGGIYNAAGSLTIRQSTIIENFAVSGGGLFNMATAVIEASTFAENAATNTALNNGDGGGAIVNGGASPGTLTITNSTISGNRADGHYGGIYNFNGSMVLNNVTLTNNVADADRDGSGNAGGLGLGNSGTATIRNTLVAGNRAAGPAQDCLSLNAGALASGGYNLIGNAGIPTDCVFTAGIGDQTGTPAAPIDARLNFLADYGGPTLTHALMDASPAIDRGDPTGCSDGTSPLSVDQRGAPRGGRCDVGAYELARPLADAGADQRVSAGTTVTLDGTASSAWGGIVSYSWTQVAGVPVALATAGSATASFTAPSVPGVMTFQLAVADRHGTIGLDAVNITVNGPPTADAGADQTVDAGHTVTLNGTASRDDGVIVGYAWEQTGGAAVTLTGADTAMPTFIAPATADTLSFQLTVTDNDGATHADSVTIVVTVPVPPPTTTNQPPVAKAGPDQSVPPRSAVILNGRRSFDPDGRILSYHWVQTGGVPVTLFGASWPFAGFIAPKTEGSLTFQLTVTDDKGATGTDNVTIAVDKCGRRWYERFFDDDEHDHHGHNEHHNEHKKHKKHRKECRR